MKYDLPLFDPFLIASSGQCFRMHAQADTVTALSGNRRLVIRALGGSLFDLDAPPEDLPYWESYLDLDGPYAEALAALPASDSYLQACASACRGLRILRQDVFETLISFIISQRKSIPAICGCVEKLCRAFGEKQEWGYAFPSPAALAGAEPEALAGCGVGYRAGYIRDTARAFLLSPPPAEAPSDELLRALLAFPGVGIKVASCVMLFAFHRLDAAPVDVWIQRVIREHYHGVNPFPSLGPYAGIYQQYMFFCARLPQTMDA